MTTSAASKDNPKSGRKTTKQSPPISSSLKTIMKYGGDAVGKKESNRKLAASNVGKETGPKRLKWENTVMDEDKMTSENNSEVNEVEMKEVMEDEQKKNRKTNQTKEDKDMGMMERNATKEGAQDDNKWDEANDTMDIDSNKDDIIHKWESEINDLEKEIVSAATEDYRKMMEKKLMEAQRQLKQTLLSFTYQEQTSGSQEKEENGGISHNRSREGSIDLTMSDDEIEEPTNEERREQPGNTEATVYDSRRKMDTFKWGDMSDDETVTFQNQTSEKWNIITNKKQNKKSDSETKSNEKGRQSSQEQKNSEQGKTVIANPYVKKIQKNTHLKNTSDEHQSTRKNSSIASFLEITKGTHRSRNDNAIRVKLSFTPRTAGAGEYARIAKELLTFGKEIDPEIMLLPWMETETLGPINIDDLTNPKNLSENIKKYVDKPSYVNWQPGSPVYGIGIHFSTNFGKYEFLNRWNLKKQEYKQNSRAAYAISLAPMQKSPTAYIIGIAVGSTEKQDYEILNNKLGKEIGIDGIEVSFQNIHQAGITQEFWKIANDKAAIINRDKLSRDHLREKYRWAPNALAVYVHKKELVSTARKAMIKKYGKSIEGNEPIWPDGSSMRFLPVKGPSISNEKTRMIVRKRMAYHIWLKANEIMIDSNFVNIHQSIEEFEGLSFAEIVLQSTDNNNQRVFSHINRVWSSDPSKEKWALSVRNYMAEEASQVYKNLQDTLFDKYGPNVNMFFDNKQTSSTWRDAALGKLQTQEEDDDWFDDDDDIDEVVKKGIVDSTFLQFFNSNEDDEEKKSVASWGTGNTTYTEIITTQESYGTAQSSITQDTPLPPSEEEIEKKKAIVRVRLMMKGIQEGEIQDMLENKSPYELAFSGIRLPTWEPDKEVFMLLAIRQQNITQNKNKHE